MAFHQVVHIESREKGRPCGIRIPPHRRYSHVGIHDLRQSSFAHGAEDRDRFRPSPEASDVLIAVAIVLLVESLLGQAWAVLGFCLLLGVVAWKGVRHRTLLAASAVALVVNTLLLPQVPRSATASYAWAWLAAWGLEG